MHEYSIVSALIGQVEGQVAARRATAVRRVEVAIGELAGVEVELLKTAYTTFRERTVCERAEMSVRTVEARWECPRCGRAFAKGERLRCDACGRPARLAAGDEIVLERLELEVP